MKITDALVFDIQAGFVQRDLCISDGVISSSAKNQVSAKGCYLIPGLTDLHFHGCAGEDFSDATADGLQTIADYALGRGITQICPAGMTLSQQQLSSICSNAAAHSAKNKSGAELVGINLEGPFLSKAKKGAQNADFLQNPNVEMLGELQKAANGLVKLVTIAPEQPNSFEFIEAAVSSGITVSLGHTTAGYNLADAAFKAGAKQATHLFNAMPPFNHREPGVVGAAFDNSHVYVELICDGIHIHPSVVRAVFRLFGRERVILISDSLRATGMPDGIYPFGGQKIEVKGNRATMLGEPDTLAGSVTDLMGCIKTAVSFGIPLEDAVIAAAVNPAKVLNIYDRVGSFEVGKSANIAVLDSQLNLKAVIYHGSVVSGCL